MQHIAIEYMLTYVLVGNFADDNLYIHPFEEYEVLTPQYGNLNLHCEVYSLWKGLCV